MCLLRLNCWHLIDYHVWQLTLSIRVRIFTYQIFLFTISNIVPKKSLNFPLQSCSCTFYLIFLLKTYVMSSSIKVFNRKALKKITTYINQRDCFSRWMLSLYGTGGESRDFPLLHYRKYAYEPLQFPLLWTCTKPLYVLRNHTNNNLYFVYWNK